MGAPVGGIPHTCPHERPIHWQRGGRVRRRHQVRAAQPILRDPSGRLCRGRHRAHSTIACACGLVVVGPPGRRRRLLGVGAARREMGRRSRVGGVALRLSSAAQRHPHLVGPCCRRRDTTHRRRARDDARPNGARPRMPLPGRQGCRGHRCAPRATELKTIEAEILAERYRGRRGIRRAREALSLVDPGAESPCETWLRLLLIRAGFPRPQTQIPVYDEYGALVGVLDMGWQDLKLAVEYEGDHHRTDRRRFNRDIRRAEALTELGWLNVRVTVEDTPGGIIGRVSAGWQRRACS